MQKVSTPARLRTLCFGVFCVTACAALTACGGGGSGSTSGGSSTSNPATSGGSLSGASANACAPNLCVDFQYEDASAASQLSASLTPNSAYALSAYKAHYTLISGSIPAGLSLNASTGEISGTPTQNGSTSAKVELTVDGYTGSLTTSLLITISSPKLNYYPSSLTGNGMTPGVPTQGSRVQLQSATAGLRAGDITIGAANHLQFAVIGSVALPPGLSLDAATGAVSGTPVSAGVWFVQIQATTNTQGVTGSYTTTAGIVVEPVIHEHGGQTAGVVQMPVYAPAGVAVGSNIVQTGGNYSYQMSFDRATSTLVITPSAIPVGAKLGTYSGAYIEMLSLPDGTEAEAGYIEIIE